MGVIVDPADPDAVRTQHIGMRLIGVAEASALPEELFGVQRPSFYRTTVLKDGAEGISLMGKQAQLQVVSGYALVYSIGSQPGKLGVRGGDQHLLPGGLGQIGRAHV